MSFFKQMDLYKGIILMSALLMPACVWWISGIEEQITLCQAAKRTATKRGGYLEEIGKLKKQIEVVAQNRRSESIENPTAYFEPRIRAASPDHRVDDFSLKQPQSESVTIGGRGGRQKAVDQVVTVDWGKGKSRREFQLDFVYAVLFNCESGARAGGGAAGPPSVWRLRDLELRNVTADKLLSGKKTPPPELGDRWHIREMKFARREPRAK